MSEKELALDDFNLLDLPVASCVASVDKYGIMWRDGSTHGCAY